MADSPIRSLLFEWGLQVSAPQGTPLMFVTCFSALWKRIIGLFALGQLLNEHSERNLHFLQVSFYSVIVSLIFTGFWKHSKLVQWLNASRYIILNLFCPTATTACDVAVVLAGKIYSALLTTGHALYIFSCCSSVSCGRILDTSRRCQIVHCLGKHPRFSESQCDRNWKWSLRTIESSCPAKSQSRLHRIVSLNFKVCTDAALTELVLIQMLPSMDQGCSCVRSGHHTLSAIRL